VPDVFEARLDTLLKRGGGSLARVRQKKKTSQTADTQMGDGALEVLPGGRLPGYNPKVRTPFRPAKCRRTAFVGHEEKTQGEGHRIVTKGATANSTPLRDRRWGPKGIAVVAANKVETGR